MVVADQKVSDSSQTLEKSNEKTWRTYFTSKTPFLHTHWKRSIRKSSVHTREFAKHRFYGFNKSPSQIFQAIFPLFSRLAHYRWNLVVNDLIGGCIVAMIHLPQAMAGAMTAVMKPHHGLYMTIFPALVYAFLSSSPQNHVGGMPITAAVAGVSAARIRDSYYHQHNFTADQLLNLHFQISGTVAFLAGLIQISSGFLKLGFLAHILSSNVLDPFSVACCLQAICGQVPIMLGIQLEPYTGLYKHPWLMANMLTNMPKVNGVEALISSLAASIILGFREFLQPALFKKMKLIVPIEFIVLVTATVLSYALSFKERFDVRVMGPVSQAIPLPKPPPLNYLQYTLTEALINAIVSFGLTLNSAKILARKNEDKISPNQELIAIGCTNLIGSFCSCFIAAAPVGRSIINQSVGSRSQLSSIFGCLLMATLLVSIGSSLCYLPVCIVSTNIVVTLIMTVKIFADVPGLWKRSRLDAVIWMTTFLSCILLDVRLGLLIGLALALFSITYQSQKLLGHVRQSAGFLPLKYYKEAMEVPGMRILQIQSVLHYGNAEFLVKQAKYMIFEKNAFAARFPNKILNTREMRKSLVGLTRKVSLPAFIKKSAMSLVTRSTMCLPQDDTKEQTSTSNTTRFFLTVPQYNPPTLERSKSDLELRDWPKINKFNPLEHTTSEKDLDHLNETADVDLERIVKALDDVICRVILDLSMTSFIDSVGFRALEQLASDLEKVNMELFISHNKVSLIRRVKKRHLLKNLPEENIFLCVEDAVMEAMKRNIMAIRPKKEQLEEAPDQRFYPTDAVRVEGLPGTN